MKNYTLIVLFACLFLSGCNEQQPEWNGTIKASVNLLDEQEKTMSDKSGCLVSLEGTNPLVSKLTDKEGKVEFTGIPIGTYSVICKKDGFGDSRSTVFMVVGGEKPLYFKEIISKKPTTKIRELTSTVIHSLSEPAILIKAIIEHQTDNPRIVLFLHNEDNVSNLIFSNYSSILFNGESGTQINWEKVLPRFPKGSKVYVVAYGYNYSDYWNGEKHIFTAVGQPSNIASFIMP